VPAGLGAGNGCGRGAGGCSLARIARNAFVRAKLYRRYGARGIYEHRHRRADECSSRENAELDASGWSRHGDKLASAPKLTAAVKNRSCHEHRADDDQLIEASGKKRGDDGGHNASQRPSQRLPKTNCRVTRGLCGSPCGFLAIHRDPLSTETRKLSTYLINEW
jgi:hypothetical protein